MMDYGLELAGWKTVWQVEINDFCQAVLHKHWPDTPKFEDVRSCGRHNLQPVTLISGGFPCQNISEAGKMEGLGTPDSPSDRSGLWFHFRRIIHELRPTWVLVENVARLLLRDDGDTVLANLEEEGYASVPLMVGTSDCGAPSKRQRVFMLAYRNDAHGDYVPAPGVEAARLFPTQIREIAETQRRWARTKLELGTRTCSESGDSESQAGAYDGIVRRFFGNPLWLDQTHAIGNSVTPIIPCLIGGFIAKAEAEMEGRNPHPRPGLR